MAKGYNPADAHRKAQKVKEKKKNKQDRVKAKELGDVKKNTGSIENEIKELSTKERNGTLSASEKADLEAARAELTRLRKAKDDYIKANPEQRDAVLGTSKSTREDDGAQHRTVNVQGVQISFRAKKEAEAQGLRFDKKGKLLNPEKSAYYDPTFNPYGVPPPGMPYRARPPTAEEMAAIQAAQESSDDDIIMPEGPHPDGAESDSGEDDSDDSDDIAMPEGPPPSKPSSAASNHHPIQPPMPSLPFYPAAPAHPQAYGRPPAPPGFMPYPQGFLPPPPPPMAGPSRQFFHASPASSMSAGSIPPRPPPTISAQPTYSNGPVSASPITQEGSASRTLPPPPPTDPAAVAQIKASATISAAPQVRDLKKEALSFAPTALKRKRPGQAASAAASRKVAKAEESINEGERVVVSEDLRERASAMRLPPGFGGMPPVGPSVQSFGPQYAPADLEEEGDDGLGEEQQVALPPGFGQSSLPGFDDEEDDGEMASVALPPGFGQSTLPGFDDDEQGEDDYQGPSLPTGNTYSSLPGFDDEDEDDGAGLGEGEEQGVSLPPGFHGSTLPDDGDDDNAYGDVQGMSLPPGFGANTMGVTVEESDED